MGDDRDLEVLRRRLSLLLGTHSEAFPGGVKYSLSSRSEGSVVCLCLFEEQMGLGILKSKHIG